MGSLNGESASLLKLLQEVKEMKTSMDEEPPDPDDPDVRSAVGVLKSEWSHLTALNLLGKNFGDFVIAIIGMAMEETPFKNLRSMELGGNSISASGISHLAKAIEIGHLPALEILRFYRPGTQECSRIEDRMDSLYRRNKLGDSGFAILTKAMSSGNSKNLKIVNVEFNGIGPMGCRALSDAFPKLSALEELNLSFNELKDEGIEIIAEALGSVESHLKVLDLDTCAIGSRGMMALIQAFRSGRFENFTELYVGSHGVLGGAPRDDSLLGLAELLERGRLRNLQVLDITGYGDQKTGEAFLNAYRRNDRLAFDLRMEWPSNLRRKYQRYLNQNREDKEGRNSVIHGEDVSGTNGISRGVSREEEPAMNGKIFICGFPEQGKTTLGKSLQREPSALARERRHHYEPRTQGIEISYIDRDGLRIAVWDLAGQSACRVLHSAFLPDLAFADGQGTTFIIVCNAKLDQRRDSMLALKYWMRFIASSSIKGGSKAKRHVILVLNRFNGEPCMYPDYWEAHLKELKEKFDEYLVIEEAPFVVDARVASSVAALKSHLFLQTQERLKNILVPRVCRDIHGTIAKFYRTNTKVSSEVKFPVLNWQEFASQFPYTEEAVLRRATNYLHESGELIFFRKGQQISEGVGPGRSLVVLNPDWFCREVVGHLLLPQGNQGNEEAGVRLDADGSITLRSLLLHFLHLRLEKEQVDKLVAMLLRLGICYMVGGEEPDKVLIPALIREEIEDESWTRTAFGVRPQWVMGYSLKVMNTETALLPIAVFRRLQVELASDDDILAADNDYKSGKYRIMFKKSGMAVMVEFGDEGQDQKDRIDILVRPLGFKQYKSAMEKKIDRQRQLAVAHMILSKILPLAETWSPGVEFVHAIIKPWSSGHGAKPMEERDVQFTVEDVKRRVQVDGIQASTNWEVGDECVEALDLLSGEQLKDWELSVKRKCKQVDELLGNMKLTLNSRDSPDSRPVESHVVPLSSPTGSEMWMVQTISELLHFRFDRIEQQMERIMQTLEVMRRDLSEVLQKQTETLDRINAVERFTRDERSSCVPRFLYLTESGKHGIWATLEKALRTRATLHFLCEQHRSENCPHEVKGQAGVELTNLKEWAARIAPWVKFTLKVAFVVGKAASQAVLPGLTQLIATFPTAEAGTANVDAAAAFFVSAILITGAESELFNEIGTSSFEEGEGSSPGRPIEVKGDLKAALKDMIGEMSTLDFKKKFKLQRVWSPNSGHILWMCDDCFQHQQHFCQEDADGKASFLVD